MQKVNVDVHLSKSCGLMTDLVLTIYMLARVRARTRTLYIICNGRVLYAMRRVGVNFC